MRLKDRVAVVTGAAGGIGKACVDRFLAEGARVAALDLKAPESSPGILSLACDVCERRQVDEAASRIAPKFGAPDILVHSAAISASLNTLDTPEATFHRIMAVNVWSVFNLAQVFVPDMRSRQYGSILLVSSITGIVGAPGLSAYSASKGALITLTRTLALELAESQIRVNVVCPASVDTGLLQTAFHASGDPALARVRNIERHPLGRLGTPEDIASLALFLVSDEASWITGGTYVIDGGASIARRWKG